MPPTPTHDTRHNLHRQPRLHQIASAALLLGRRQRIWTRLVEASGAQPGDHVLDVGCGSGYFSTALAPAVMPHGTVTGIDPSEAMIRFSRDRATPEVYFEVATSTYLPFDDATFDVVVANFALSHRPLHELKDTLTEMFHVLRPGGRLLIADLRRPRMPPLRPRLPAHRAVGTAHPTKELQSLITTTGFTITGTGQRPLLHYVAALRAADNAT